MTVEEVKDWLNRAYKIDEDIEEERKEYIRRKINRKLPIKGATNE